MQETVSGIRAFFRSPFGVRILVGAIGVLLFVFTLQVSLAGPLREGSGDRALAIVPYDSRILSRRAAELITNAPTPESAAQAEPLAVRAILRDPTNVVALRTLALVRELQGKQDAAARLMLQSETLSRRDMLTQLWLVEYYSRNNDVPGTLHHYDIAMRSSQQARDILMPILASASSDPEIQRLLRPLLAGRPLWWREFVNVLNTKGNPGSVVAVTQGLMDPRIPEDRQLVHDQLTRLTTENRPDLSWGAFVAARRRADPRWTPGTIRNGGFESGDLLPLFDWSFAEDPDLNAGRVQRPDGGQGFALALNASSERSGDVAFQLLHLAAGRYVLAYANGGAEGDAARRPSVTVGCTKGEGGRLITARATEAKVREEFSVPADCAWQWLTVRANASAGSEDSTVWIDDVAVQKVQQ